MVARRTWIRAYVHFDRDPSDGTEATVVYTRAFRVTKLLDILERLIQPIAVPYLPAVISAAQIVVFGWAYLSAWQDPSSALAPFELIPSLVIDGEWWRVASFLIVPPTMHPLWAIISWMCFIWLGMSLERQWGMARLNLFLLLGWIATVAASFAAPDQPTTNGFIGGSVFLAFAVLWPETIFMIFFVLPVKAKTLAKISWVLLALVLIIGDMPMRLAALASVANWCAFFLPTVIRRLRERSARAVRAVVPRREVRHRCGVCGRTDRTDPQLEFRYCDKCEGIPAYCIDHIRAHEHVRGALAATSPADP